jgi:hypothetical protein
MKPIAVADTFNFLEHKLKSRPVQTRTRKTGI